MDYHIRRFLLRLPLVAKPKEGQGLEFRRTPLPRFATLDDGTPDGRAVMVSDDGQSHRTLTERNLQTALDADRLVADFKDHPFDMDLCAALLPRAYQFLDGSAYVNHVELVRKARGAEMPASFWTDPLMYQGCSVFEGPTDLIRSHPDWGTDFEAEIAVVTSSVPQGVPVDEAAAYVELVTMLNDVSLRDLIPPELAKGFGFVNSKPPSALGPIAVSPDDLPGWTGRKLSATMCVDLNGRPFGRTHTDQDMTFDFGQLIAHAAKTRPLPAGTVIGSGTVSNKGPDGDPGKPVSEGGRGYACIAEQRMVEIILHGVPTTPFLSEGDRVRIWVEDGAGKSLFGTIDQTVTSVQDTR